VRHQSCIAVQRYCSTWKRLLAYELNGVPEGADAESEMTKLLKKLRNGMLLVAMGLATASPAFAENFYVAEGGTGTGTSCSSPRSGSWFNSGANWANPKQTGRIGPGDVVYLCGTLTTDLTLQNDGSAGAHVTIDGSSATLSSGFSFNTNNRKWWRIQKVTWNDGAGTLINISGGSDGILTEAHADNVSGDPLVWISQYNGAVLPNNITISNSYLRTGSADYGNTQHDMIKTEGSTNVVIEGNYLEMRAGGAGSEAHDDIIQTFEKGGTSAGNPGNWTIRYNWMVMNSVASNDRSWTMMERLSGSNYIYGNVFLGLQGAGGANGLNVHNSAGGAVFNIFNNTFVAKGTASNNVLSLQDTGTANITNNVFHLQNQTALTGNMPKSRSYNLWYGANIPSCTGITGELCGRDPMFTNYTSNNFSLQSASPARSSGTTLGPGPAPQTLDRGLAVNATWPNPAEVDRVGPWDRGSYQGAASTTPPAPPTNVRVVIR